MTDLPTLAATLLTNFATIRLRRCERLWTWAVEDPSARPLLQVATDYAARSKLILGCNRQYLRQRLLDDGHRAFFDRLEGDGPHGWRLHFFCLDPSAIAVLYDAGLGECGPGETVSVRRRRNSSCGGSANWSDPVVSTSPPTGGGGLISSLARIRICGILSLCQFALPSMADQALIIP